MAALLCVTLCSCDILKLLGLKKCEHEYTAEIISGDICTNGATIKYTCTKCGESYTEEVPAKGHDFYISEVKDPLCIYEGYVVYSCRNCDETYTEKVTAPYVEHDYIETVLTEATCETAGELEYKCSRCGDSYNVSVSKKPHSYETVNDTALKCQVCGQKCTHPANLSIDDIEKLYEEMRTKLIAALSESELSEMNDGPYKSWFDYSTYYDGKTEDVRGLMVMIRAEYRTKEEPDIIDHEKIFPFQMAIRDGKWQFLTQYLIELQE